MFVLIASSRKLASHPRASTPEWKGTVRRRAESNARAAALPRIRAPAPTRPDRTHAAAWKHAPNPKAPAMRSPPRPASR